MMHHKSAWDICLHAEAMKPIAPIYALESVIDDI